MQNGEGFMTFPDGSTLTGHWLNGQRHGVFKKQIFGQQKYEEEFYDNGKLIKIEETWMNCLSEKFKKHQNE